MQQGDLEQFTVPRWIIVLEGVLCGIMPIERKRRLREPVISGYHINWYEVPLKRTVYLKEHWPDASLEIVTFVPDLLDSALGFLDAARIPYDRAYFNRLDTFVSTLRFQHDLQRIYDSDVSRLDRFGQYGVAVVPGNDF